MDKRINTMAIQFEPTTNTFYLDGKGVTYAFCINEYGYAEHLYYGKRIGHDDLRAMRMLGATSYRTTPPGRDLNSSSKYGGINSYHHFPAELAFFGTGDFREPAVELTHADGNRLTELLYVDHEILPCKPKINGMPSMRGGGNPGAPPQGCGERLCLRSLLHRVCGLRRHRAQSRIQKPG